MHCAIPALGLLKQMLENMKQTEGQRYQGKEQQSALKQGIESFNDFYKNIIIRLKKKENLRSNSHELETFRKASEILCEIQKFADPRSFSRKPEWLDYVIECAKSASN